MNEYIQNRGGAEVVAQPHAFKSSVIQSLILHQRMRARQVARDVRPKLVQVAYKGIVCREVEQRSMQFNRHFTRSNVEYQTSQAQLAQ